MAWDVSTHPARWTGPQLAGSAEWVHRFTSDEAAELRGAARRAATDGAALVDLAAAPLPLPSLAARLAAWRDELCHGRGFILAKGFPIDMAPEEVRAAYVILGAHLGRAVGQNVAGDLLCDVRDDGADPTDPTVRRYRTRREQPFHVDGSDLVGLLCLHQGKSGGVSQIVSSVTVYDEISRRRPDLEPLIRSPWCFDGYGQFGADGRPWFERPILVGSAAAPSMFYLRWYVDQAQRYPGVTPLSDAQRELLDLIDSLAADPELNLDMAFEPGDVQLLSNHTVLHSRTAYEDFDEPDRRRHLLRLWLQAP